MTKEVTFKGLYEIISSHKRVNEDDVEGRLKESLTKAIEMFEEGNEDAKGALALRIMSDAFLLLGRSDKDAVDFILYARSTYNF